MTEENKAPEPTEVSIMADRKALIGALKKVSKSSCPRTSLAILAHAHFQAANGDLMVTSTDLETAISLPVPGWVKTDGEFTAPIASMLKMLGAVNCKVVELTAKGDEIHIEGGGTSYILNGLPAEEFPWLPEFQKVGGFKIPANQLDKIVKRMRTAVSTNVYQWNVLCGIKIISETTPKGDTITMLASDTHRLAIQHLNIKVTGKLNATIPDAGWKNLAVLIDPNDPTPIEIEVSDSHARFILGDGTVITAKLLDGQFPDYYTAVTSEANAIITLNRQELLTALRNVRVVSDTTNISKGIVHMYDDHLNVIARNYDGSKAKSSVPIVDLEGDKIHFAINCRHVYELAAALDSEYVQFIIDNERRPFIIADTQEARSFYYLLAPVTIGEEEKPGYRPPVQEAEKIPA